MTAKEYLGQAYRVDLRIRCKMEQVQSLRELAVKASSTLSDMPKGSGYTSKADIVAKIVDYENEINKENQWFHIHRATVLPRSDWTCNRWMLPVHEIIRA